MDSERKTHEWAEERDGGVVLHLVIQPKASKNQIVGPHGEPARLKVRVAAPPVDGEANEELIAFLAKKLGVPKSFVTFLRGQTGKQKDLFFQGISLEAALGILNES